jgi:hypothetical protein
MRKLILPLFVFAAIAGWTSAQGPTASEHLKMLKTNRELLLELMDQGVEMSNANTSLKKAERCQKVAGQLSRAMKQANDRDDTERMSELGDQLAAIIGSGLMPNLQSARDHIPVGSAERAQITVVHRNVMENLNLAIPAEGKTTRSASLRSTRQKLVELSSQLGQPE